MDSIFDAVNNNFTSATQVIQSIRRDPMVFDLDGDGIQTATGWVLADYAFLVWDKNANGLIDNGRELFGDAMLKSNGQLAADGFDALRDLNQDSISQSGELLTLDSAINLGSFVKTDGISGTLGEVSGNIGDINLVQDTFHSQFADSLDTTAVSQLPDMHGAGQVRDLREAATLSSTLAQLLSDFTVADSRSAQQALLPAILQAWSDTSAMAATFTGAYAGHNLTVTGLPAVGTSDRQAWEAKITLLEHFNGRTFHAVPAGTAAATLSFWSGSLALLNQSYNALGESVYQSLLLQARLKPYLDAITLNVDSTGIHLDFTAMMALLTADKQGNAAHAYTTLLELQKKEKFVKHTLNVRFILEVRLACLLKDRAEFGL